MTSPQFLNRRVPETPNPQLHRQGKLNAESNQEICSYIPPYRSSRRRSDDGAAVARVAPLFCRPTAVTGAFPKRFARHIHG